MKRKISFKLFLTVLCRGVCQLFKAIGKLFGYKEGTTFGKFVWRVFATCVTTLLLLFTGCMVYMFCDEVVYRRWIRPAITESVYEEKILSRDIVFQELHYTNKGRVFDKADDKTLIEDVNWVAVSEDSLAVFAKEGKRGYLNRYTGDVVIPADYKRAWVFSEGLAAVEEDNRLVFIDKTGNVVIDKRYVIPFENEGFVFQGGYCAVNDPESGKMGLVDKNGEWALTPEYDNVWNVNGYWKVEKDSYMGLFTSQLDTMFAVDNCRISITDSIIDVRQKDHIGKRYDYDGNVIVDFVIDAVENMQYETTELRLVAYQEGEDDATLSEVFVHSVADCQKYVVYNGSHGDYYGLISRSGKLITLPEYTSIEAVAQDLYLCQPQGIIINGRGQRVE